MTGDRDHDKSRLRRHSLSPEDEELWHSVVRTVSPAKGKKRVTTNRQLEPQGASRSRVERQERLPQSAPDAAKPKSRSAVTKQATLPTTIDRRKARQFAQGRQRIEARIDLHGMYQAAAHQALRAFLLRCSAQGLRHVLVITGKGSTSAEPEDWSMGQRERGVLRRNVPRWLAEPELSALVVATAPAHARHGGDGALYVTLRVTRRRVEE
jgi:DNA-nicking Smr family endonuclease